MYTGTVLQSCGLFRRIISGSVALVFCLTSVLSPARGWAQEERAAVYALPPPGTVLSISEKFVPVIVRGLTIDPHNPLQFDFIIDTGDEALEGSAFEEESRRLIKYFLAALTVPEKELWVNLSPYEGHRIIPEGLGVTEMGRDMLAQDYLLKQLTASLLYPEKELGQAFWQKVYRKAYEIYGTANIPVNTFNKVWIVPDKAVVYEHDGSAFVVKRHLKVMLEQDYVALQNNLGNEKFGMQEQPKDQAEALNDVSSQIVKEIILPAIEQEVNEGATFANLRQIYNSMILATWYKRNLRESLLGQVYVDRNKVRGIDLEDKAVKDRIYAQYLETFKQGVYNYIREDYDEVTREKIPRKYFSGGLGVGVVTEDKLEVLKGRLEALPASVSSAVSRPESANGEDRQVSIELVENAERDPGEIASADRISSPIMKQLIYKWNLIRLGSSNTKAVEKAFLNLKLAVNDHPSVTVLIQAEEDLKDRLAAVLSGRSTSLKLEEEIFKHLHETWKIRASGYDFTVQYVPAHQESETVLTGERMTYGSAAINNGDTLDGVNIPSGYIVVGQAEDHVGDYVTASLLLERVEERKVIVPEKISVLKGEKLTGRISSPVNRAQVLLTAEETQRLVQAREDFHQLLERQITQKLEASDLPEAYRVVRSPADIDTRLETMKDVMDRSLDSTSSWRQVWAAREILHRKIDDLAFGSSVSFGEEEMATLRRALNLVVYEMILPLLKQAAQEQGIILNIRLINDQLLPEVPGGSGDIIVPRELRQQIGDIKELAKKRVDYYRDPGGKVYPLETVTVQDIYRIFFPITELASAGFSTFKILGAVENGRLSVYDGQQVNVSSVVELFDVLSPYRAEGFTIAALLVSGAVGWKIYRYWKYNSVRGNMLLLSHREENIRLQAINFLGESGESRVIEPLLQSLQDSSESVRVRARYYLDLLGVTQSRLVESYAQALLKAGYEDALIALGKWGGVENLDAVIPYMGIIPAADRAFQEICDTEEKRILGYRKVLFLSENTKARESAVKQLRLFDPSGEELYRAYSEALQSPRAQARAAAVDFFIARGDKRAVETLYQVFSSHPDTHMGMALVALGDKRADEYFEQRLTAESDLDLELFLASRGHDKAVERLIERREKNQRPMDGWGRIVAALGSSQSPQAAKALIKMLGGGGYFDVYAWEGHFKPLAEALLNFNDLSDDDIMWLNRMLWLDGEQRRWAAVTVLEKHGTKDSLEALEEFISKEWNPGFIRVAHNALIRIWEETGSSAADFIKIFSKIYSIKRGEFQKQYFNQEEDSRRSGRFDVLFREGLAGMMNPHSQENDLPVEVVRPFDPGQFNFNKDFVAAQQLFPLTLAGYPARINININPEGPEHFILLPEPDANLPQVMEARHIEMALALLKLSQSGKLKLGHNSLGAAGGVNHLHIHGIYNETKFLPIEEAAWVESLRKNGVFVNALQDYPARGLVFSGQDDRLIAAAAGDFLSLLRQFNIPYTVLMTQKGVFVLPRQQVAGQVTEDFRYNLGFSPMAGRFYVHSEELYKQLSEADIYKAIADVTVTEDLFNDLVAKFLGGNFFRQTSSPISLPGTVAWHRNRLTHESPVVRKEAVEAMALKGGYADLAAVAEKLNDDDEGVRLAAATAVDILKAQKNAARNLLAQTKRAVLAFVPKTRTQTLTAETAWGEHTSAEETTVANEKELQQFIRSAEMLVNALEIDTAVLDKLAAVVAELPSSVNNRYYDQMSGSDVVPGNWTSDSYGPYSDLLHLLNTARRLKKQDWGTVVSSPITLMGALNGGLLSIAGGQEVDLSFTQPVTEAGLINEYTLGGALALWGAVWTVKKIFYFWMKHTFRGNLFALKSKILDGFFSQTDGVWYAGFQERIPRYKSKSLPYLIEMFEQYGNGERNYYLTTILASLSEYFPDGLLDRLAGEMDINTAILFFKHLKTPYDVHFLNVRVNIKNIEDSHDVILSFLNAKSNRPLSETDLSRKKLFIKEYLGRKQNVEKEILFPLLFFKDSALLDAVEEVIRKQDFSSAELTEAYLAVLKGGKGLAKLRAIKRLGDLKAEEAQEPLLNELGTDDVAVLDAVEEALASIDVAVNKLVAGYVNVFRTGKGQAKLRAIKRLGDLKAEEAQELLLNELGMDDVAVLDAVEEALASIDVPVNKLVTGYMNAVRTGKGQAKLRAIKRLGDLKAEEAQDLFFNVLLESSEFLLPPQLEEVLDEVEVALGKITVHQERLLMGYAEVTENLKRRYESLPESFTQTRYVDLEPNEWNTPENQTWGRGLREDGTEEIPNKEKSIMKQILNKWQVRFEQLEKQVDMSRDNNPSSPLGGIDFNPEALDLQIRRDGDGVPLPLPEQPVSNMKIDGFLPVIIHIAPANIPLLLGLAQIPAEGKIPDSSSSSGRALLPAGVHEKTYSGQEKEISWLN